VFICRIKLIRSKNYYDTFKNDFQSIEDVFPMPINSQIIRSLSHVDHIRLIESMIGRRSSGPQLAQSIPISQFSLQMDAVGYATDPVGDEPIPWRILID
jgi:hypothetical protein